MGYRLIDLLQIQLVKIWLGACTFFIDWITALEAVKSVGRGDPMSFTGCDKVREAPARSRRRLESAVAPASIQEQTADGGSVDDG